MAVPVSILRAHGVSAEDVARIERAYGPELPAHVHSADAVIAWVILQLPWPSVAPLLRSWVERVTRRIDAQGFAVFAGDARLHRVLSLLCAEPPANSVHVRNEVRDIVHVLTRVRGVSLPVMSGDETTVLFSLALYQQTENADQLQAWCALLAAAAAACAAQQHQDALVVANATRCVKWVVAQAPQTALEIDRIACEAARALAEYLGTWTLSRPGVA